MMEESVLSVFNDVLLVVCVFIIEFLLFVVVV